MFIQTEETPNPATLKFIPDGNEVLSNSTAEFKNQKQASTQSPLAMQLFAIDGIEAVFFGHDFITITKSGNASWQYLTPEIQAIIMDFFISKKPIMFEVKASEISKNAVNSDDSEIVKQIKELIEIKVRPAVAMDGGDIIFHSFEDGIVYLVLKGSCSGCPSSTVTLKSGIENMLKHYIPEVEAVEQVSDDA
ncbi:MAG: NifU family protein [Proteobacteria bacterium]|nr:NifU family protein [Pseudomonadota bacterium]NCA27853.1 NifU family protein [Pseudomonadota bacterium]